MKKIAITGGIGAGKSYVVRHLAQYGIEVFDCDAAAKELMRTSSLLRTQITQLIGMHAYHGEQPDKDVIARFILSSSEQMQALNDIVHPAVARSFEQTGLQWLESAILFESEFYQRTHLNKIVCVTAPLDIRITRIVQRDNITQEQAQQWIARQLPQEEVAARADYTIINDGIANIDSQINNILKNITK